MRMHYSLEKREIKETYHTRTIIKWRTRGLEERAIRKIHRRMLQVKHGEKKTGIITEYVPVTFFCVYACSEGREKNKLETLVRILIK